MSFYHARLSLCHVVVVISNASRRGRVPVVHLLLWLKFAHLVCYRLIFNVSLYILSRCVHFRVVSALSHAHVMFVVEVVCDMFEMKLLFCFFQDAYVRVGVWAHVRLGFQCLFLFAITWA